jgi:hypothetical protein
MAFSPSSPVTGASVTGLTSPTYTIASDTAPDTNAKQVVVTALGGTQTGVTLHSISSAFTIAFWRPKVFKLLGMPDANGLIRDVQRNVFKLITRKGVTPLAGQPVQTMIITTVCEVPAGADLNDAANVRAALSAHGGTLAQTSVGISDTLLSGTL